jgi:hypothetical protein
MNFMEGKKTYVIVFMGLVSVWGAFMLGEMQLADGVVRSLELLGLAGLRMGVASVE